MDKREREEGENEGKTNIQGFSIKDETLMISISHVDTSNLQGSRLNLFISIIPSGYDYHAGCEVKIGLICSLTK